MLRKGFLTTSFFAQLNNNPLHKSMKLCSSESYLIDQMLYKIVIAVKPLLRGHPLFNGQWPNSQQSVPLFALNWTSIKPSSY